MWVQWQGNDRISLLGQCTVKSMCPFFYCQAWKMGV